MGAPCIPIFILLFLSSFCKSDDTLTHAKPLTNGDTLISKSGDFALGFFPATSSNKSLYLGIWYNNIPEHAVVWVANRDSPITTSSSAMLAVTNSSDLVLSDSQGRTPWATKNNIPGTGVAAVLLDTGNLVLQLPNGTKIWQSFHHPTDTILPTVKILMSDKAGVARSLVAWKNPNDPSAGDFSLGLDPSSNRQMVVWHGTTPHCRISMINGPFVSGDIFQNIAFSEVITDTGDGFSYVYTVPDGSPYTRIMLDYTGVLRTQSWNSSSSWATISERPSSRCEVYASCGPFGYCDDTGAVSTCHCLYGFELVGLNFSGGACRRTEALECKESKFEPLARMKVPDKFLDVLNRSSDECKSECISNCSCTAYAYIDLMSDGAIADQPRCLVWTGKLVDTGKSSNYGETLSLWLADSPVQGNSNLVKIILPTIVCLLILTCIVLVSICKYKASKRRNKEIEKRLMLGYISSSNEIGRDNGEFPFVSFEDVAAATDNFSDSKQIGRGGFGKFTRHGDYGKMEKQQTLCTHRLSRAVHFMKFYGVFMSVILARPPLLSSVERA